MFNDLAVRAARTDVGLLRAPAWRCKIADVLQLHCEQCSSAGVQASCRHRAAACCRQVVEHAQSSFI